MGLLALLLTAIPKSDAYRAGYETGFRIGGLVRDIGPYIGLLLALAVAAWAIWRHKRRKR